MYSTSAGIGGAGLNAVAHQTLKGVYADGILGRVVAAANRQADIPGKSIRTLQANPVRLLRFLGGAYSHGARRHVIDKLAAGYLGRGNFDLFHSWAGDCVESLRVANRRGIPALLEIPTWHRDKGVRKPRVTEAETAPRPFPENVLRRLLVSRQQTLEEYDRADVLLVLSQKARETFLIAGIPEEKLFLTSRGVDVDKFLPAENPPDRFRAILVGSLSRRKGVPSLLEAWRRLALKDAELVLVGHPTPEVAAMLKNPPPGVQTTGFVRDVAAELRGASLHVFPSECEGSAKVTYEASACGLAQITTREAGDVVVHQETGLIVPPNNVDALAEAMETLYRNPELRAKFGAAGRRRMAENFTWDHFRKRVRLAYARAAGQELKAS